MSLAVILQILLALIILGIVWWMASRLFAILPIAEPFRTVIYVLAVGLISIFLVIWLFGLLGSVNLPRLR